MSGIGRMAARVGIHVVVTVVLTLALAWLIQEVPALAWVLAVASLALLGLTALRVLRRPPSPAALGLLALAVGAGWLVSVAAVGLLEDAATADPDVASPAVETSPSTSPTTTSQTTTSPTTTSPTTTSPATSISADDGPGSVRSIEAARADGGTVVTVETDGEPAELWLFSTDRPAEPVIVEWRDDAWGQVGGREAEVTDTADGLTIGVGADDGAGWAVVDDRGNRVPESGHVDADDAIVEDAAPGAIADRIAAQVVAAQTALPGLDDDVAGLVLSLLGRQLTPGTFVLDRSIIDGDPTAVQQLAFVAQWPRFTQHLLPDRRFGVWALPDEIVSCDAEACTSTDILLPAASAAAVAAAPDLLELDPVEPGSFDGQATTCVDVVSVPAGGPSLGRTCWLPDGRPTLLERTEIGDRLVLSSRSPAVDTDHLEPPR